MKYTWVVPFPSDFDPRLGIRVRHVLSGNDGDVCNSIVTFKLLEHSETPYCIDIGVDQGWWSFFVAMMKPKATIDAFEPNPKSFMALIPYLESTPQLRLHNYAISDTIGTLPFTIEGGTSHSRNEVGDITVPCITLGRYIQDKTVDLIKIDTEGHDIKVLKSLHPFLDKIRSIIFECTVYQYGSTPEECIRTTVDELTFLKKQYAYMYALSRRGDPCLDYISDVQKFAEHAYSSKYQTDIVVCNTPLEV